MSEYLLSDDPLKAWTAQKLSEYIAAKGLGDYSEFFLEHNIDGKVAHRLDDSNLKEMGVSKVGDRLKLLEALEALKKAQQQQTREVTIWEGEEVLYFSCYQRLCSTCCGCCPEDPSQYKLQNANLEIKLVEHNRCGPCVCCYGHKYTIDHIDLSQITDADVEGVPPTCFQQCCCCGATQEWVHIKTSSEGEKILKLHTQEGQVAVRKIKNQVEIMQRMERS